MASRSYLPGTPTVYPDTSTLCHAYRAAHRKAGSDPAHAPLATWLEKVASNANLCLSCVHLGELSAWGNHSEAEELAAWLEGLPVVWTLGFESTERLEAEHWLRIALGLEPVAPFGPFAPSFGSALAEINPSASVDLLRDPRLPRLLREFRRVDWQRYRNAGFAVAQAFRVDRDAMRADGGTPAELERRIEAKREDYVRRMAREAHDRLRGKDDYSPRLELSEIETRFLRLVRTNPRALPSLRIARAFDKEFIDGVERRTAGSGNDREQLPGTFGDRTHAVVGGAYCGVFTCDRATATAIEGARKALGFPQTFAPGFRVTGVPAYVQALTASC